MRARTVAFGALGALVVAVAGAGVAAGQDFKQFASGAGRYKVMFPGDVKTETTDVQAGKDTLKLTIDSVELKGDTVFLVSYIDATEEVGKQPAGPRLDKVRDGNKGPNGKVVEEKEVTVPLGEAKHPGRDLLIETPGGYLRNRAVIVGPRLYQVMIQGTKEVVTSPSADKFINSFELTK
jgi:hypothetical protein